MPITATLAMVASAAMAGVPLLNGFLSKEMFFAETVYISSNPWVEWGLPIAATIAGIFAVVYALRFSVDIFFGEPSTDLPRKPHEPSRWMRVPIELLVLACLVVGIFPAQSIGPVLAAAANPVVGGDLPDYDLALWHGFNAPFVMSVLAMIGGALAMRGCAGSSPAAASAERRSIRRLDGKSAFESRARAVEPRRAPRARALRHAPAAAAIVPDHRCSACWRRPVAVGRGFGWGIGRASRRRPSSCAWVIAWPARSPRRGRPSIIGSPR